MVARRATCRTAATVVIAPFLLFAVFMCASAYQMLVFQRVVKEWSPKDCHKGGSIWSLPLLGTVMYNISWTYGDCEQAQKMMQPRVLRLSRHLTQEDAAGDAAIAATLGRLKEAATPMERAGNLAHGADPASRAAETGATRPGRRHLSQISSGNYQPDSAAVVIGALREAAASSQAAPTTLARSDDRAAGAARNQAGRRHLSQTFTGGGGGGNSEGAAAVVSALRDAAASDQAASTAATAARVDDRVPFTGRKQGGRRLMAHIA